MTHTKIPLPPDRFVQGARGKGVALPAALAKARVVAGRFRDLLLRFTGHLPTNVLRVAIYRHCFGMRIAKGVRIEGGCLVWGPGRIEIGAGSVINRGVVLDGRFPLRIGSNASISLEAVILTLQHDLSDRSFGRSGPRSESATGFSSEPARLFCRA